MFRTTLTAMLFAAITALAAGQNPPPVLLASEQLKLWKSNRALLDALVARSLQLSTANNPLERAIACHKVLGDLGLSLTTAVTAEDSARVAELSGYLAQVVRLGLIPALVAAYADTPKLSEGYVKLKALNVAAADDLSLVERSIPQMGTLGKSTQLKDARGQLQEVKGLLDLLKKANP